MDFLSPEEKMLEKEFLSQGFIVRDVANIESLKKIQKFAIDMLSKKEQRRIYDEYKYYETSPTSKYYPMNNPTKVSNFWKTRNFSMDIDHSDGSWDV